MVYLNSLIKTREVIKCRKAVPHNLHLMVFIKITSDQFCLQVQHEIANYKSLSPYKAVEKDR